MKLRGLRQARQRQGLSISQLADMTGLRRETITRFEHGQEEPQPYALRRLSAILETSPAELSGVSPEKASAVSKTIDSPNGAKEELSHSHPLSA